MTRDGDTTDLFGGPPRPTRPGVCDSPSTAAKLARASAVESWRLGKAKHCERHAHIDRVLYRTPTGPHHGEVLCGACGRFLGWMPKPR